MGLASYGDPEMYGEKFRDLVRLLEGGRYEINLDYFQYHYLPGSRQGYVSGKFIDTFGPPRKKEEDITVRHQDIAAALQLVLEESVIHIVNHLAKQVPNPVNLCLAGGVALNCSMNSKIMESTPFEQVYIQPASGDDGIAIGAGYWIYHNKLKQPRQISSDNIMRHAYWGPEFSDEEITELLEIAKLSYKKYPDVTVPAAKLIADGNIVAWFQGRMEFGPRALGNRSILADPTRPDMMDIVNHYVKHREDFRPFAPVVPVEDFSKYFESVTPGFYSNLPEKVPVSPTDFMLLIHNVVPHMRDVIPAVTHTDGTARVQTIRSDINPKYYKLLREFEKLKGVSVVLNTSFNVKGEPIVCSPSDAIRCFASTGIDYLVISDNIVSKHGKLP